MMLSEQCFRTHHGY